MPPRWRSAARSSTWDRSSSSIVRSSVRRRIVLTSRRLQDIAGLLSRETEHTRDALGHAFPVAFLLRELPRPLDGQAVVLGAAVVLGRPPLGLQQAGRL